MRKHFIAIAAILFSAVSVFADITIPQVDDQQQWPGFLVEYYRHEHAQLTIYGPAYSYQGGFKYYFGKNATLHAHGWVDGDDPSNGSVDFTIYGNNHAGISTYDTALTSSTTATILFYYHDFFGWHNDQTDSWSLVADFTPPVLTATPSSTTWTTSTTVKITYNADDQGGSGVKAVYLLEDKGDYIDGALIAGTNYVNDPSYIQVATSTSASGTFTVPHWGHYTVVAIDNVANSTQSTITIADANAPKLTVLGYDQTTAKKSATVQVSATDTLVGESGVNKLSLKYSEKNGTTVLVPAGTVLSSTGSNSTGTPTYTGTVNLNASGNYTLTFDVSDYFGNPALTTTITQKILAGIPAMNFAPNSPTGNNQWYKSGTFNVSQSDAIGTALTITSKEGAINNSSTLADPVLHLQLVDGVHSIDFHSVDEAGNSNDILGKVLKVDSVPPTIRLSYVYSGGAFTDLDSSKVNYLHSDSGFQWKDNSSDATSGIDVATAKYQIDQTGPGSPTYTTSTWASDLVNFPSRYRGQHTYYFQVSDLAGNQSTQSCQIVYTNNAIPIQDGSGNTSDLKFADASTSLVGIVGANPINANAIFFEIQKSDLATGNYAAPATISVQFDGGAAHSYSFSDSGNESFISVNIPVSTLTDGSHNLGYSMTDLSGLVSSGTINFKLHRAKPQSVQLSSAGRFSQNGSTLWVGKTGPQGTVWTIAASSISEVIDSVAGWDGIKFTYSDNQNNGTFPLTGYVYQIVDQTSNLTYRIGQAGFSNPGTGSFTTDGASFTYQFQWGAETLRTLILSVVDEAGQASDPQVLHLVKPQSGNLNGPVKMAGSILGQNGFTIAWNDDGNGPSGSAKGVRWSGDGYSSVVTSLDSVNQAIKDGDILTYQAVVQLGGGDPTTPLVEVQKTTQTAYVTYELLPTVPGLAASYFVGSATPSSLSYPALTLTSADGTSVQYALELTVQDAAGARKADFPYNPASGSFLYNLYSLFPNAQNSSQLKTALNSATLNAQVIAWYGTPLVQDPVNSGLWLAPSPLTGLFNQGSALPATGSGSTSLVSSASLSQLVWDVDAPSINLTGMMLSGSKIANARTITGTSNDVGTSGLSSVSVAWAPQQFSAGNFIAPSPSDWSALQTAALNTDGSFSFVLPANLTDGAYQIQVIAIDRAGNQASITQTKVFDTTAPSLKAFQLASGATDSLGNVLADLKGSVSAQLSVDDHNGVGIASVSFRWVDAQGGPLSSWANASVSPNPVLQFDGFYTTNSYNVQFSGAPTGVSKLQIKLVDKSGNASDVLSGTGNDWQVAYSSAAPNVTLNVTGTKTSEGRNWIANASDLTVGYSDDPVDPVQSTSWNVELVNADGSLPSGSDAWSAWGSTFDSVKGRIAQDGQSYRIQLQVKNANGVTSAVLSSPVLTKDGIGPQNVTAALSGTTFVVGQEIGVTTTGNNPTGNIVWTWSYQASGGLNVVQDYRPGNKVIIPSAGNFNVVFTAKSGSGIATSTSPVAVTVSGVGLAVNDNQLFNDGKSVIGGRWNYVGGTPASYSFRWLRSSDGAVLQDWTLGDSTNSATLSLSATGVTLKAGDVVALEVKALDGSSNVLADATSLGSIVDLTGPLVTLISAPNFVSPNDVWLQFKGSDPESATLGSSLFVKKLVAGQWQPVTQINLSSVDPIGQKVDLNLSANSLNNGDQIVVEVSVENKAGLTTSATSGILIVDAAAPPTPVVVPLANAVRYKPSGVAGDPLGNKYQNISFGWGFTPSNPTGDAVSYSWQAVTDPNQLNPNGWTDVAAGTSAVTQDYSNSGYSDGTILYFVVRATSGAGLVSVGYSSPVILDSTAPWVSVVTPEYKTGSGGFTAISGYVQNTSLGTTPQVYAQLSAADFQSGVQSFDVEVGTWSQGTGYVSTGNVVHFAMDVQNDAAISPAILMSSANGLLPSGSIWMVKGTAFDNAGNETVVMSPAFKVIGTPPQIGLVTGNLGQNIASFTWQVNQDPSVSDFIQGYQISLAKVPAAGGNAVPVSFGISGGHPLMSLTVYQNVWNGDWGSLGYQEGDQIQFSVTPVTGIAGLGNTQTATLSVWPETPTMTDFDYTRYFSNRFNVRKIAYQVPPPAQGGMNIGVQQIQWRLVNSATGQFVQDWTSDYSASTSWKQLFASLISDASKIPVNGGKYYLEIRAESQMGVWSSSTFSQSILIDQTQVTGVAVTRNSAYSNAVNHTGKIDGWNLAGTDSESGILAYQVQLSTKADGSDLKDWNTIVAVPVGAVPGANWNALGVAIPGADTETSYYAFIRLQNGTEDWGTAVSSTAVKVRWTAPTIALVYSGTVLATRDSSGNALTNTDSEVLTFTSNEPGTSFDLSINGGTSTVKPSLFDGSPGGDPNVLSYGTFTLLGPGTDALSVTATDLYGNQATVADKLRFNLAPAITIFQTKTTPGQTLNLEQLVTVTDDVLDLPMTYSWNLGGGTPVGFSGQQTSPQVVTAWPTAITTQAMFFQNGKNQVTTYPLQLTVSDVWGKSVTQTITIEVDNTSAGKLFTNEYWSGPHDLTGMVEVPSGLTLTLDGAIVSAGAPVGTKGVMDAGILIDAGSNLTISNASASSVLQSGVAGQTWRGISVSGVVTGSGLEIDNAENAFKLLSGGLINLTSSRFNADLIALHLYGGTLQLGTSSLSGNLEYGVKEEKPGSYVLTNNKFMNNRVNYYQLGLSKITIDELNGLSGNGGNQ